MSENWGYCEKCHKVELVKEGFFVCCTHNIICGEFSSEEHARQALNDKIMDNMFIAEVEREIGVAIQQQIKAYIKENMPIPAMKLYRTVTGFGLKEAREYVFRFSPIHCDHGRLKTDYCLPCGRINGSQ